MYNVVYNSYSELMNPDKYKPTQRSLANLAGTDLILDFTLIKKDVIN